MAAFITGFKPFLENDINPSELVVDSFSELRQSKALEASYTAADLFIDALDASNIDHLVCLGLNAHANCIRLERFAYNEITKTRPDVLGFAPLTP